MAGRYDIGAIERELDALATESDDLADRLREGQALLLIDIVNVEIFQTVRRRSAALAVRKQDLADQLAAIFDELEVDS